MAADIDQTATDESNGTGRIAGLQDTNPVDQNHACIRLDGFAQTLRVQATGFQKRGDRWRALWMPRCQNQQRIRELRHQRSMGLDKDFFFARARAASHPDGALAPLAPKFLPGLQ